jgi:formylglycine-generating enzyme required for sulfatase activity
MPHQKFAQFTTEIINSIGMKLVRIPKGTFMMGLRGKEKIPQRDETRHK